MPFVNHTIVLYRCGLHGRRWASGAWGKSLPMEIQVQGGRQPVCIFFFTSDRIFFIILDKLA
jgi:hypothetical protein